MWNTPSVDTARHLIVFSTGNASPDVDGSVRPGDNLCADCIVAVDYRTGKRRWYLQEVPHDVWDLDAASPVLLFDARDSTGRMVPAAGQAGKSGLVLRREPRDGRADPPLRAVHRLRAHRSRRRR